MSRKPTTHDESTRGKEIVKPQTKYARHLRAQAHEVMRERIKGQQHLNQVTKIAKRLHTEASTLSTTEIQALKASADIQFKILGKILPDLKSSEINVKGSIEHRNVQELSVADLSRIIEGEFLHAEEDDEPED